MPNMSFFHTTTQFIEYRKDTTRRLGWDKLKAGKYFTAVKKAQGLRKGEHITVLGQCQCLSNEPEPLIDIVKRQIRREPQFGFKQSYLVTEVEREGFPEWRYNPMRFVDMFCKNMSTSKVKITPDTIINRIVFRRLD